MVVNLAPAGESRFIPNQVFVAIPTSVAPGRIQRILAQRRLTEVGAVTLDFVGVSYHAWTFDNSRNLAEVMQELAAEGGLGSLQPNYLFDLADELAAGHGGGGPVPQYALINLRVAADLDRVSADPVKVAVIDTAIDETHPDLAGSVEARFDAIGGGKPIRSLDHGTAMAGAIAAHGQVHGVAPSVRLLSARAFDTDGSGGALGSSLTIIKAIDWSVRSGARILNMSFAGPRDPALHDVLKKVAEKGVVMIGAAGNAGPKSPPLYPAADENVIAITASDDRDRLYSGANIGAYVAAAAPGVDVLLPAPNGGYAMETGTSVSAALASGVAALVLERSPNATAKDVKKWLTRAARPLSSPSEEPLAGAGAGVIDAGATVREIGR